MTWRQFGTFLYGSAVVILDALIAPLYKHLHERSKRHDQH